VQAKLFERAGLEVLARDVRASVDLHVRGPRSLAGLTKGVVDAAVTKTYDVPSLLTMVSAGRCVTTKTGGWKVGSSPHGPMPRSAMRRPMISAPMLLKWPFSLRNYCQYACARQSPMAMPEEGLEPPTRGL
jgi:hypothetical protein